MPRKSKTTSTKNITTEKKYTAVAPAAKPMPAKPVVAAAAAKVETPAAAPTVVTAAPQASKESTIATTTPRIEAAITQKPAENTAEKAKQLIAALRDFDADIARDAAMALGKLGDSSAVEPLIGVVANADGYFHTVVRSAGAASLGQLKDKRAVDALLNAVYDQQADASSEAIAALAAIGDRRAVSTLIDVVRNNNGFFVNSVRRAAVLGLIKFGGEEAQAELQFVSSNGWEDSVIREEATAAVNAG